MKPYASFCTDYTTFNVYCQLCFQSHNKGWLVKVRIIINIIEFLEFSNLAIHFFFFFFIITEHPLQEKDIENIQTPR